MKRKKRPTRKFLMGLSIVKKIIESLFSDLPPSAKNSDAQ